MKERGKNCAILFVALSHSWFSSLLACHTACLTQKTTSLSKQSKSASKILRKTAKSVQYFPKNAYYTCFSHEILINVFNIFGTNSHVKHKKCEHRNWVRIISREKKKEADAFAAYYTGYNTSNDNHCYGWTKSFACFKWNKLSSLFFSCLPVKEMSFNIWMDKTNCWIFCELLIIFFSSQG